MKGVGGTLVLLVCAVVVAAAATAHDSHHEVLQEQHLAEAQPTGEFLEDAIGDWLTNFDTYTFMVKEDVDSGIGHGELEDNGSVEETAQEETTLTEEEEEEPAYAPITVSLGDQGLLSPHLDYQVLVESLVAEEGSVFITLSNYANKSLCGVGGFSLDLSPNFTDEQSEGRLDIEHKVEDFNTTIIAFALESESNSSSHEGSSAWDEISEDFWWARGRLVGGGVLALTFTPPECGCLTLSTYYALPVGNLTLVVGPQAYPTELQTLMCVDPSARYQDPEEDEDLQAEESIYPVEENALVNDTLDIPQVEEQGISLRGRATNDGNEDDIGHPPSKQSRKRTRQQERKTAKRLARKRKRQQKRQKIRQAGRRKSQQHQENKQSRRKGKNNKKHWKRKHGRKGKKFWKKFRKHALTDVSQHDGQQLEHHHGNSTQPGNNTDEHLEEDLGGFNNNTGPQGKEKKLVDVLLDMVFSNSTFVEDNLNELEESSLRENNEVPDEAEEGTPRSRRKNRRRQKKLKRRGRKNMYGPGVKFCCKQGVKHKKYLLILNNTLDGDTSQTSCNVVSDIVTTFANHQFAVAQNICESTFSLCCSYFTNDMWSDKKAKKIAHKMERKQRQKSRRQHRKQQRRDKRQQRREQKRNKRQ